MSHGESIDFMTLLIFGYVRYFLENSPPGFLLKVIGYRANMGKCVFAKMPFCSTRCQQNYCSARCAFGVNVNSNPDGNGAQGA